MQNLLNKRKKLTDNELEKRPHYGLRKLSVGVASVLLSTTLWLNANKPETVKADSLNQDPGVNDNTVAGMQEVEAQAQQLNSDRTNSNQSASASTVQNNTPNASQVQNVNQNAVNNNAPVQNNANQTPSSAPAQNNSTVEAQSQAQTFNSDRTANGNASVNNTQAVNNNAVSQSLQNSNQVNNETVAPQNNVNAYNGSNVNNALNNQPNTIANNLQNATNAYHKFRTNDVVNNLSKIQLFNSNRVLNPTAPSIKLPTQTAQAVDQINQRQVSESQNSENNAQPDEDSLEKANRVINDLNESATPDYSSEDLPFNTQNFLTNLIAIPDNENAILPSNQDEKKLASLYGVSLASEDDTASGDSDDGYSDNTAVSDEVKEFANRNDPDDGLDESPTSVVTFSGIDGSVRSDDTSQWGIIDVPSVISNSSITHIYNPKTGEDLTDKLVKVVREHAVWRYDTGKKDSSGKEIYRNMLGVTGYVIFYRGAAYDVNDPSHVIYQKWSQIRYDNAHWQAVDPTQSIPHLDNIKLISGPFGDSIKLPASNPQPTDGNKNYVYTFASNVPDRQKTVKFTVHYVVPDGYTAPDDNVQTFTFTQHAELGNNNEVVNWVNTPDTAQTKAVKSPEIENIVPDQDTVQPYVINPARGDVTITVQYTANHTEGVIYYIDQDTNTQIGDDVLAPSVGYYNVGDNTHETTKKAIDDFTSNGYDLVKDETNGQEIVMKTNQKDNIYHVYFKHHITTNDEKDDDFKVTRRIHYTGAGDQTPKEVDQVVTRHRTVTTDEAVRAKDNSGIPDAGITYGPWIYDGQWSDVKSPEIAGYLVDKKDVPAVTVNDSTRDTDVYVNYSPAEAHGRVYFNDQTTGQLLSIKNLVPDSGDTQYFTIGEDTGYTTAQDIKNYTDKGYELVSDDTNGKSIVMQKDDSKNTYHVVLRHKITTNDNEEGTPITRTIHYVGAGDQTPKDVIQVVKRHRTATTDEAIKDNPQLGGPDKATTYDPWTFEGSWDEVKTPVIDGFTPDQNSVASQKVDQNTKDTTITITYVANNSNGRVYFTDQTTGQLLATKNLVPDGGRSNFHVGEDTGYTTAQDIKNYTDKGYELVSDDTNSKSIVMQKDDSKNVYHVVLKHKITTSTDESGAPVTRTIHYTGAGDQTPKDVVQTVKRHRTVSTDEAVKDNPQLGGPDKATTYGPWTFDSSWDEVKTPAIDGFTPDQNSVASQKVDQNTKDQTVVVNYRATSKPNNPDDSTTHTRTINYVDENGNPVQDPDSQTITGTKNNPGSYPPVLVPSVNGKHADIATVPEDKADKDKTVTVHYMPNGNIVPVDENGNKIPNSTPKQYETDPQDPSKVTPNEKVPDVDGYTPKQQTVTPTDPGKDTPVVYVKNGDPTPVSHTRTINFHGPDGVVPKDSVKQTVPEQNGNPGDYAEYKVPVIKGYHADIAVVPKDKADKDKTVDITYKPNGNIVPVDENGQPIPDAPKTPYNNDPQDPTKTTTTDVPKIPGYTPKQPNVTPTDPDKDTPVTYVKTPDPSEDSHTRTIIFKGPDGVGIPDKPVEQTVKSQNGNPGTYPEYNVPVVNGYHADMPNVPTDTADKDKTVTVTYVPNGKIIPVDKNGNPIPGAQTPTYKNDPQDPTKATTTDVPDVPGYTSSEKNVTPDDPNKDTNVVYNKNPDPTPTKGQANIIVEFYDSTDNVPLNDHKIVDKIGQTVTWDQTPTIQYYIDAGYKLISDGYANVLGKPLDQNQDNHIYTIVMAHDIEPVHGKDVIPKGRYKGQPVNLYEYKHVKTVYTYNSLTGPKAHDDYNQDIEYDANGTVDLVTGKVTRTSDFTEKPGQTIEKKIFPIDGYHGDIMKTETQGDTQILHVVYVKEDGTATVKVVDKTTGETIETIVDKGKIGDNVPYPSDKITGYTNKGYTYDPKNWPNPKFQDTPQTVVIELEHKTEDVNTPTVVTQTIHYVGPDGKQIAPDNVQKITFNHHGKKDLVTGQVTYQDTDDWTKPKNSETVASPNVKGYKPDKDMIGSNSYKNTDKGQEFTVHYTALPADKELVTVTFFDVDTGNRVLAKKSFTGEVGQDLNYTTASDLAEFAKRHYLLSKDETGGKDLIVNKDSKYNNFAVFLKHEMQPGFTRTKTVTRTIQYITPDGKNEPQTVVQTLTFNDLGEKDLVTNKMVWNSDITPIRHTFAGVETPKVDGMIPDQDEVKSRDINVDSNNWNDDLNQNITVMYHVKSGDGQKTQEDKPKQDDGLVPGDQGFNPNRIHKNDNEKPDKGKHKKANKGNAGKVANGNHNHGNGANGNAGNASNAGNNNANANNGNHGNNGGNNKTNNSIAREINRSMKNNGNGNLNNGQRRLPQAGSKDSSGYILLGLISASMATVLIGVDLKKRRKLSK